jgi:CDGSH-type Zn-finger protein
MEKKVAQKMPYVMDVEPGRYAWCSCGHSSKQPYCDGSHKGSGMAPIIEEVTEAKKVAWCGCKASGNGPFCDGAHAKL